MKRILFIMLILSLLIVPALAIYSPEGRYYVGGGSAPYWNADPGNIYLIGGFNASFPYGGCSNDTYYSMRGADGGIWSRTIANGVAGYRARYNHKATPVGGAWIVLTGGTTNLAQPANDTWLSQDGGATWTLRLANAPWVARAGHMQWSNASTVWLFGGRGNTTFGYNGYENDSYKSVDWGTTWTKTNATRSLPHARAYAGHTQDFTTGRKFYMCGGMNQSDQAENDCWMSTDAGVSWTQTKANYGGSGGGSWSPRYNPMMIDTQWGLILYGGVYGAAEVSDIWRSGDDGATWTQLAGTGLPPRQSGLLTYNPVQHILHLFGGVSGGTYDGTSFVSRDGGSTWYPYYQAGYGTAGTYSMPAYYTGDYYNLGIAGAGGSGMPSTNVTMPHSAGYGGFCGEYGNYTRLSLVAGTSYPVTVGAGGITGLYNTQTSNPGGLSAFLDKTKQGGRGGGLQPAGEDGTGNSYGTNGNNTYFFTGTARLATNATGINYGLGGIGYGAGGGGAGTSGTSPHSAYLGGNGSYGVVAIWTSGYFGESSPRFTISPSTTTIGTLVNFTDTSQIRVPGGLDYTWDFGDGTTSKTQGNVSHAYGYAGTFTPSLRITSSAGDLTDYVENGVIITGSTSTVWYSPTQVRFTVLDWLGNNVVGATVNATYVQSTLPDAIMWLQSMYGVSGTIAAQMLSNNTVMSGTTGTDGAVVFSMHSALQYNVSAWNSSSFIQTRIYPKEQDYNIWLPQPSVNNTYAQIGYNLTYWQPNNSYQTLGGVYQDNGSLSSKLMFYVNATNGTVINYTYINASLGTTAYNITKTIPNTRGESFYWGISVVRPASEGGNISVARGVTSKGANGVLVDLGLPSTIYYPWIAFFCLLLITSLASKSNVRFLLVLMVVMAAMFWWFGWLQGVYLTTVIPFAALLAAIFYMKGSLRENYGVGGSGSMLVNIVVFLIILQMMIGFINGIGVFNQAAMANPNNQFTNVDLTTIQNTTSNFGGINDPLQSANNYAAIGWATVKILLSMVAAVFVVGIFLAEMFPYFPPAFFAVIQGGIYVLYVLFIAKMAGKLGSEVDL